MANERIVVEDRGHKLVALMTNGTCKGKTWNPDGSSSVFEGDDLAEVLSAQKDLVDKSFVDRANSRTTSPAAIEYVRAFQSILQSLPDSYLVMLKAHYRSPNQNITSTELAEACDFKNYNAAVLHYGTLGSKLYEQLPINLPADKDGKPVYTYMLATEGDRGQAKSDWSWKMRPEIADAIAQLGLCD